MLCWLGGISCHTWQVVCDKALGETWQEAMVPSKSTGPLSAVSQWAMNIPALKSQGIVPTIRVGKKILSLKATQPCRQVRGSLVGQGAEEPAKVCLNFWSTGLWDNHACCVKHPSLSNLLYSNRYLKQWPGRDEVGLSVVPGSECAAQ